MRLQVKVSPRASKKEVRSNPDGSLKVYLMESPEDGKANKSLLEILADYYRVKKSDIRIVTGKLSRNKIVEITGGESGTSKEKAF